MEHTGNNIEYRLQWSVMNYVIIVNLKATNRDKLISFEKRLYRSINDNLFTP